MNWFSLRFPSKLVDISPNSRLGLLFEVEERLRERNFRAMLSGERTVEAFFFLQIYGPQNDRVKQIGG